eukprot:gene20137-26145_t
MSNGYDNNNAIAVHPPDSLVKFDSPLFVGVDVLPENGYSKALQTETGSKLDDMINSMLPPREWTEDSGVWMQYISKDPASRDDVITLQEHLDNKLKERKARETGICAVREELYSQSFDEIIRQVALDGPERGLLLMRVRDEIRMTIDSYKILYSSAVNFGVKKQLKSEFGIPNLEEQLNQLEQSKSKLELEVLELRSKLEIIEKREIEKKSADEKRRKEELDFLRYQGQHLDSFLKQMNAGK